MKCNHCHPLCQCGAEEAVRYEVRSLRPEVEGVVSTHRSLDEAWVAAKAFGPCIVAGVEAPRFPELESIEAALLNYAEAE